MHQKHLTDQLCKDMVIVFANRKQKQIPIDQIENVECISNAGKYCVQSNKSAREKGRKRSAHFYGIVYKVFNHIYLYIHKHLRLRNLCKL